MESGATGWAERNQQSWSKKRQLRAQRIASAKALSVMSLKCFKGPTDRQVTGGAWTGGNTVGDKIKEGDRDQVTELQERELGSDL